jgi:hypothetical protein
VPQFGQTIRKFTNNVSEMKKLAARDYEDLLQVNACSAYYNIHPYTEFIVLYTSI